MQKEIRFYRRMDGKEPFTDWFMTLKDIRARAQVKNRLERVSVGNYGDYKSVGGGIFELRIHYGSGYSAYFVEQEKIIVLFLVGGDKNSQKKDIQKAKEYLADFQERYS